jgi:hypothetical protein
MTKSKKRCIIINGLLSSQGRPRASHNLCIRSSSNCLSFRTFVMERNSLFRNRAIGLLLLIGTLAASAASQVVSEKEIVKEGNGNGWRIVMVLIVAAALGLAFYFWRKSKNGSDQPKYRIIAIATITATRVMTSTTRKWSGCVTQKNRLPKTLP